MKLLLAMLIEKFDDKWWRLRSSSGDPPEEREGHYVFAGLMRVVKAKLTNVEKDNAEIDP